MANLVLKFFPILTILYDQMAFERRNKNFGYWLKWLINTDFKDTNLTGIKKQKDYMD